MRGLSELVWLYIKKRPFLREIIREQIVNYSALARKISIEAFGSKKKQNAIKMALVRIARKLKENDDNLEGKILKVLHESSISVKTKVAVVIASNELANLKYFSFVESNAAITYIVSESQLANISKSRNIIKIEQNLNLISIHSKVELETTPGVIAHLLAALASEGINLVEFVSCYTDTILVVNEADTTRTYEILSKLTKN